MKNLIVIILFFYSSSTFACNLTRESDWFLPLKSVYAKTQNVFVGKVVNIQDLCTSDGPVQASINMKAQDEERQKNGCYSYSFQVLKKIKGTFKVGDTIQIRGRLKGRLKKEISYGRDCRLDLGFNSSESYLIFWDAFHPDAYRGVESLDSAWVKEISTL